MSTGMLWLDNSKLPLSQKINLAVKYYETKYGQLPEMCLVNPNAVGLGEAVVESVEIGASRFVLPGHLWIGMKDV